MTGKPHEGSIPHSGRYPYGSGENPKQRPTEFVEHIRQMKKEGLSDTDISKALDMPTREWKAKYSVEMNEYKLSAKDDAFRMFDAGLNKSEIARNLNVSEATVRNWLKDGTPKAKTAAEHTADLLKKELEHNKFLDVGLGTAETMGISSTRLANALQLLKDKEGYVVKTVPITAVNDPNRQINVTVLCPPGTTAKDIRSNSTEIGIVNARYADANGKSLLGLKPVQSISSDRIMVAYREDGGATKDGVIELRRGIEGLDLGQSRYAQVRIGVDGTHYLKGMAIYSDNLPAGVDILFNSNKSKFDPNQKTKLDAFKEMKKNQDGSIDQDNPFGSLIKAGGQKGYLNIVREEGDWSTWSKTLAAQMLSKQSVPLAKKQLDLTYKSALQEFDEISKVTNPVVKQHLLVQFGDECDKAAVFLKATAMPRQGSYVILPVNSLKPNQVYAPNYNEGETVALIRYPHGGTFEIPELVVNKRNPEAKRLFQGAQDAIGIHPSVAEKLSGADFDGDSVVVIPNNSKSIKSSRTLEGLKGFDPKLAYPERKGMKYMTKDGTQNQMGIISNLITDMNLQGAPEEHLARAVRHSMVVIDAAKHKLDYTQSYKDNGIEELKRIYQKKPEETGKKSYGGVSTLISRAKSQVWVPDRQQLYGKRGVDPVTGEKVYRETGKLKWDKKTQTLVPKMIKSTRMAETKDARSLISSKGTAMEYVYADYANKMKALGNMARKAYLATPDPVWDTQAKQVYKKEIEDLKTKVNAAIKHQPYERKAQILANHIVAQKFYDNPSMTKEEKKKVRTQAIIEMRARMGGKKPEVKITPKEWEAIQAGAVSKTQLNKILNYADPDTVKELALPKAAKGMTPSKVSLAKMMRANGYSLKEIADRCGVSQSTVQSALSGS